VPEPPLVQLEHLSRRFAVGRHWLSAVDDVSLAIPAGRTYGLVGETGSGKSTLAQLLVGLLPPTSGSIRIGDIDVVGARGPTLRRLRQRVQIVFQDPFSSLDPRMSVGRIVAEGLHMQPLGRDEQRTRVAELLALVGLSPALSDRFPHMLSGGQRQRVALARALAVDPSVLVLDEPVSALDVSVQSQILNLLADLGERLGLTYLFITHDLAVVRHIADVIGVMYLGRLVEQGESGGLLDAPRHPYTRALLSAAPGRRREGRRERIVLEGEIPSPIDPPPGCRFAPRCWRRIDPCSNVPPLVGADDHRVACYNPTGGEPR
jgi:oligopeptide/dipeptide ABC transporter ATP-binding protein